MVRRYENHGLRMIVLTAMIVPWYDHPATVSSMTTGRYRVASSRRRYRPFDVNRGYRRSSVFAFYQFSIQQSATLHCKHQIEHRIINRTINDNCTRWNDWSPKFETRSSELSVQKSLRDSISSRLVAGLLILRRAISWSVKRFGSINNNNNIRYLILVRVTFITNPHRF